MVSGQSVDNIDKQSDAIQHNFSDDSGRVALNGK